MNLDQRGTETIAQTANVILIIIFLSVLSFFGLKKIDQFLRERAIDNCARISRYEATIEGGKAKATYPIQDVYKKCLKDKGY